MNAEHKKIWVDALRSGDWKQGIGKLHNITTDTYCCLGVACDLYNRQVTALIGLDVHWPSQGLLPVEVQKYYGLSLLDQTILTRLNDREKLNFHEIADYIEVNL